MVFVVVLVVVVFEVVYNILLALVQTFSPNSVIVLSHLTFIRKLTTHANFLYSTLFYLAFVLSVIVTTLAPLSAYTQLYVLGRSETELI